MNLVLCAGSRLVEGYTHHDVKPLPGIDIVCDLWDIHKYVGDMACDRIEFTHALEHFPMNETVPLLQKIHTLMKPDAELYLEVPNFEWHAKILLQEGRDEDAVMYAFGGQEDEWDFHKAGFTQKILYKKLEEAGFKKIQIWNDSSLIAKAYA